MSMIASILTTGAFHEDGFGCLQTVLVEDGPKRKSYLLERAD
jgi:hypothetical protein